MNESSYEYDLPGTVVYAYLNVRTAVVGPGFFVGQVKMLAGMRCFVSGGAIVSCQRGGHEKHNTPKPRARSVAKERDRRVNEKKKKK